VRVVGIARLVGVGAVTASMLLTPRASADPISSAPTTPCPDVEVDFARGTTEAPGVGGIGQAFVDSLQSHVGRKSVWTYPVDYRCR
jgi:cutinase